MSSVSCQMLTKYARILSPETVYIGGPLEGSSQQINKDLIFMCICGNLLSLDQSSIGFLKRQPFNKPSELLHKNFTRDYHCNIASEGYLVSTPE